MVQQNCLKITSISCNNSAIVIKYVDDNFKKDH